MPTLHAFANMFPAGIGETKDLWVQWALEEIGEPYEVRAWDYNGGATQTPEFRAISPFGQLPLLEDDGLVLAETTAILIHLAERSGRLMPKDVVGRATVIQWGVAAVATVSPALAFAGFAEGGMFGEEQAKEGSASRDLLGQISDRWLEGLERRLEGRDWIAADDFTIADILMAGVLREVRHSDKLDGYPAVKAYFQRCTARPAWQRTLHLYAERLGADRDAIA